MSDRLQRGRLHRLHRGVYAVGHPGVPAEGRFLAAVKACGRGAVLSHYSAAALWAFVEWDDRLPEVSVLGTAARVHPGIRVHRTLLLDREDRLIRSRIPVTSPTRTLLDIASVLGTTPLRRAVGQAQADRRVQLPQLLAALARYGRRPGARRLRKIIAKGPAPTRSELEDVVLDLIVRGGLARPDVNVAMTLDDRRIVPDFRWPAQRLVLEADGGRWHDHPLAREDDAERQALLEVHGERVIRVTWEQATQRPTQTLSRLRGAGAPDTPTSSLSS